jgi:hypothetical protein
MLRAVYLSILLVSLAGRYGPRAGAVFPSAPSNSASRHRRGGQAELRYIAELWCTFSTWASLSRGSSGSRSRTFVVRRYTAGL